MAYKKKYLKYLISLFAVCIFLGSCLKDDFDFSKLGKSEWNPEFAIPIINTSLKLSDLLVRTTDEQKDYFKVDADNFITLIYNSGDIFSVTAKDVLTLPNQSFSQTISPGVTLPQLSTGDSASFQDSQLTPFNSGSGNKLDSLYLKKAVFTLDLSSSFSHSVEIKITLPSAKKNGKSFTKTIAINYTGSTPVIKHQAIDLSGYKLDLSNGGTTTNEFMVEYDLKLKGSGMPVNSSDELTITCNIDQIEFGTIFGILELEPFKTKTDSIELTIFKSANEAGTFSLVSPKIGIYFNNSFGLPLSISFPVLKGVNTVSGNDYDLSNYPDINLPNPFELKPSQIGQVSTDSIVIKNQAIVDFINDKPRFFIYQLGAASTTGAKVFVLDTSRITVNVDIELPLHGRADIFTVQDTVSADFESIDEVSELMLRVRIRNGFPIDVFTQIYLTDSNFVRLDSLIQDNDAILPAATVGSDDRVITYTEKTTDIVLTPTKIANLTKAKHMIVKGKISTFDDGTKNVKIYADYALDVKAGIMIKGRVKF